MSVDPFWNHVMVLLPMSSLGVNETRHGYTVHETYTTGGNLAADSADQIYSPAVDTVFFGGETSGASGVTGAMLRLDSDDDFTLGTGDFTIECLFSGDSMDYPSDSGVDEFTPHTLIERQRASVTGGAWALHVNHHRIQGAPDTFKEELVFYSGDFGGNILTTGQQDVGQICLSSWRHVAITRCGNRWFMFLDGVQIDEATSTANVATVGSGADIRVGNSIYDTSSLGFSQTNGRGWKGNIAQVRITKGTARYTRDFTNNLPSAPWPTAEDTGDYTGGGFTGATGSAGADATGTSQSGPPGEDAEDVGGRSVAPVLAAIPPKPYYDQQNETEFRRAVEAAFRG